MSESESTSPGGEEVDNSPDNVSPSETQQRAAAELAQSLAKLLHVGVASAGVVVQSALLRSVHQCRAEGLHRAAAAGMRVLAGIGQIRARTMESDPGQLADDVAEVLETTRYLQNGLPIPAFWLGTARRRQLPVRPRKLHGLLAEPIVTRSGYAGAAVYFLGEDEQIYTASDLRPGDSQYARDAYHGGIEIGPLIQPARHLARGLYLGSDMTASTDGRLGRGKRVKVVEQGKCTWSADAVQRRFSRPFLDQLDGIFAEAELPADARSAGWNLVFIEGACIGACGPELILQLRSEDRHLRLAIENEDQRLAFRENLRMLSHAPGLEMQVIGRLNPQEPAVVYPLALGAIESPKDDPERPRLDLPDSWGDRVCLGFDQLQRKQLLNAQPAPVVLAAQIAPLSEDPLAVLRRRWIATMLAGTASQSSGRHRVEEEAASLARDGYLTGAALLDALARGYGAVGPSSLETFLAAAVYLRSSRYELAKAAIRQNE
jgi:hypothetical protein